MLSPTTVKIDPATHHWQFYVLTRMTLLTEHF